jgi:acetoin utilization protein AcuB
MPETVKQWMSGDPVSVDLDASALEALDLMLRRGIRHLPVVDAERCVVGVLSIDDLRAALPFPVDLRCTPSVRERQLAQDWRVGDLMTHLPETIGSDEALADAADRMADRRIGCLPVVERDGRLAGLLSETDVLRAFATSRWLEGQQAREREPNALVGDLVEELNRERTRITERLDRLHAVERELSAEAHDRPMDAPERAADVREVHMAEALDLLAARRLESIDRALDHAAQGRLSICDRCGGQIPVARLRALPGTTLCVECARQAESPPETEPPFERVPGGRAETGRAELGAWVYTRFGEGQLLRITSFGTCRRCGDVEGRLPAGREAAVCTNRGCARELTGVRDRAIVAIGELEAYVDPAELSPVDPAPYD